MKRFTALTIFLLATSLACQALQAGIATPTSTVEPTLTLTLGPTFTPTVTPTATATLPPPTPKPIACNDDSCLQACLDRLKVVLETQPFTTIDENKADGNSSVDLVKYKVNGDEITQSGNLSVSSEYVVYQQDTDAQHRIWNYFVAILPADQRRWITKFIIFTDGKSNKIAYVRPSPGGASEWTLGADILDSRNPISLTKTLLHEFGHLLSLNSDQVTESDQYSFTGKQGTASCPQYGTFDGCSNPDSYINSFYQKFWKKIYPEWFKNVFQASGGDLDWGLVTGFYRRYPDQFNSAYSAASPEEDLAESFSIFVLNPKPDGESTAVQKILFFYDFPELVQLREYVIQGMCSYVQE
jgi:hypothetical protein